ncbi:MAG: hypothetical protein KGH79_04260 [Patescibacteria group bacterium]|nr:hypothetical protein [Patescibacteria group bacterium]
MRTLFIGTTPVLVSSPNPNRQYWRLEFTPSSVVAGNTGHVFVGRGFVPNGVVGDPNQGDVLNPGAFIDEETNYPGDTSVFKGAIWAVADAASQQTTYDEKNLDQGAATA